MGKIKIVPQTSLDKTKEELTLTFSEAVKGKIELFISFSGTLNDQLVGFYRSKYVVNGKEKYLATTQFEAADARRCFPCFDHPENKATFDVSLIIPENLTAVSNMPVKQQEKKGNKIIFKFDTTPIMSTYLVYLEVGELEFIEDMLGSTKVRVVTPPGKKEQGRYALELGKKFLKFYEDYFQIKYPLPKLDLIAIPDFAAGAMENWGAITFRENALLFDKKFSTTSTKQRVAEIIAHEIAHQWFGNLVTMKWWNDLWLNESFATYMATKAVDAVFPEFDFWSQFMSDSTEPAMSLDAMQSSHPIEAKVKTPKEIAEIFDDISYDKGGSILRMLNGYLGEKSFIEGIKQYLNKYKYSNTDSENLWDAFESVSGKPVKKMLGNWIKKTGYPLVEASYKNSKLLLKQSRFLLEKNETKDLWMIPITVDVKGKQQSTLMETKTAEIDIPDNHFKVNHEQMGFYRVRYTELNQVKDQIKDKKLGNIDRWGIQDDLYALCISGEASITEYLELINSYFDDDDYLVCSDIQEAMYSIFYLSFNEKFRGKIEESAKKYLVKNFSRLGWTPKPSEKHTTAIHRAKTISFLAKLNSPEIIQEVRKRFQAYQSNPESLSPDLQGAVFNAMSWSGDATTYKTMKQLYHKVESQEEKIRFLGAISSFRDQALLQQTFDFMLSDEIRYSDIIYPLGYLSGNPYAKQMLWPWAKKNWKVLDERLGETKMLLRRVLGCLHSLSDMESEKDIEEFFKTNKTKGIKMALAQTLERIRINAKFLDRLRKDLA